MAFFLSMTLYPEVQKKAQEEIDAVIGNDALPLISDRERLPYVNALTLEVLRWHAVVPAGATRLPSCSVDPSQCSIALPHRVVQEDIHEGYLIPKDTLILPNIWFVPGESCPIPTCPHPYHLGKCLMILQSTPHPWPLTHLVISEKTPKPTLGR